MATLGIVEVYLIGGKGMKNVEFLGQNDPYAIISYKTQDQKSKTLEGGGSDPVWKQKFFFEVDDEEIADVIIKVFDEDKHTADDSIGEARIPLAKVLEELEVPATLYDLVRPSGRTHGQVEVSLKFAPKSRNTEARFRALGMEFPAKTKELKAAHIVHLFVGKAAKHPPAGKHENGHGSHAGPYGDNNEGGWQ